MSANEAVEKIKILAHSRGTDITVTALRELFIEARAVGANPLERYRIESLVLAAPDLDFSVVQQRVMTEPIGPGVGQLTIYVSQGDRAIGLAEWLFGGLTRLGRLQFMDMRTPRARQPVKMAAPGPAVFVVSCMVLAGCSDAPRRADTSQAMTPCAQQRPEICAQVFEPVCGAFSPAPATRWKTYSNACTACADAGVQGYRQGACETD